LAPRPHVLEDEIGFIAPDDGCRPVRRRGVGRRLKKETPQEINSESVIGRAGGMELGGSIYSPRSILSTIFGLLGLIS
jgi:hypothetical protein